MQHVRIATYEIKDGTFQELADLAREGMLRTLQEQPGFIRYGLADLGDTKCVSLSLWETHKMPTPRSRWPSAGCASTSPAASTSERPRSGTWPSSRARPRGSDRSVVHNRVAPLHERDRAGRGSTPADSLLHDESESTMSILQDPVRPLDPSSQQEFVERGREAEAERAGPEPLEEARGLAAFRVQGQAPVPEAAMGWCE
jgi:hypothetical protein